MRRSVQNIRGHCSNEAYRCNEKLRTLDMEISPPPAFLPSALKNLTFSPLKSYKTVIFQKEPRNLPMLYSKHKAIKSSQSTANPIMEDKNMTILETKNLKKHYGSGENTVKALDGINLKIENGSFTAIVGTSGSGKSTLLHMLGGLDRPTEGKVMVDGKDIFTFKEEALTIFRRRKIGFVFQNYNLVPVLNVKENILLPIELDGGRPDKKYIGQIIDLLGLKQKLLNLPGNLSGGQQQRVAIARALASKPAIILADEPTGNLDSKTSQDVMGLLKVTSERFHQTIVMITHNEEIAQMSDRIIRIEDGRIAKDGE